MTNNQLFTKVVIKTRHSIKQVVFYLLFDKLRSLLNMISKKNFRFAIFHMTYILDRDVVSIQEGTQPNVEANRQGRKQAKMSKNKLMKVKIQTSRRDKLYLSD